MRLKDKVAVITGGNSGIGLAIAQEFSRQGAKVVISGRNQGNLDVALKTLDENSLAVKSDVSKIPDIENLIKSTVDKFGKIDVLVCNAGIATMAPITVTTEKIFDEIVNINFKGLYFTVQKAIPHFNQQASVILITSGVNTRGMQGMTVYSATKAAVRSLARSLSAELISQGIRVNALSPGMIETPIFGKMGLSKEQQEDFGKNVSKSIPIGRAGKPEEMAKAALFLATSDSSYAVGSELVADGGFSQI